MSGPALGLGQRAARGASTTLAGQALRFFIQFGSLIVLARLLTPQDFGLVAMVTAIVGVAEIVRDFGLSSAAIAAPSLSRGQRNNLFWINTGIGATLALGLAAAAPLLGVIYGDDRVTTIAWVLVGVLVLSGMNTQLRADLSRQLRFAQLAVTDVTAQAVAAAVAIAAAFSGAGYWAVVAQYLTLSSCALLINAIACHWLPGLPDRQAPTRPLLRYGAGVFGTQVIGSVTNNVDNVAIGAVWGPAALGLYSRAYQLLLVPLNQLNAPMTRVVLPTLSRLRDDEATFVRYVRRSQFLGTYLLGIGFAVAAGLAWPITEILFGPGWSGVAPIFAALAVGGIFRALTQVPYWVFLATGATGRQLLLYVWTRPVMIAILLAGLPWGALGVAIGHSVAFGLYWLVSLWRVGAETQLPMGGVAADAARVVGSLAAPAGVLAFAASTASGADVAGGAWTQVALGTLAAASYLGLAVWLAPSVRADVRVIRRALR